MLINGYIGRWGITSDYGGWFHVYAFTMLLGMIAAIFASWYKLRKYEIPTDGLALSVLFIIPAALFGASWFGKNDPINPIGFWQQFAFWKAGMSIHGGVLFGAIVGLVFFAFYKKKTKVSLFVYADCIIPNILLGQVIGRWGNFFNHELLGGIVGYSSSLDGSHISAINWLPAFIRDNCFKLEGSSPEMINGLYIFRAPIFLYESVANLGLWVIITFLLPSSFRWFSKKPWQVETNKYQLLTLNDLINNRMTKATALVAKNQTKKTSIDRKNNFNEQVLLLFADDSKDMTEIKTNNFKQKFSFIAKNPFKLLNLSLNLSYQNWRLKHKFWKETFYHAKANQFSVKKINQEYQSKKTEILAVKNQSIFKSNYLISKAYYHRSKQFYSLNNPQKYFVMRSGVQMGLYFFGWNLIRFCIELQRADDNLFIINRRTLDYTVLNLILAFGLILAVLCQFVFARYNRNAGWTYEKQY